MKKFLLFSALSFLFTMGTTAQTLLSESFEGDVFPPTGWTVIDDTQAGTLNHWVLDASTAISGEHSAYCDAGSWLNDPEPLKEEWLITPALELTNNSHKLQFLWQGASSAAFAGEYDFTVRVSADGGATWDEIWSFVDEDQLMDSGVEYPWTGWVKYTSSLDLTAYSGQTIQIAFVHELLVSEVGAGNCIKVDDVSVEQYEALLTPTIELSTTSYTFPQTYIGAGKYSDVMTIKNIGKGTLELASITGLDGTDFSSTIAIEDVVLAKNESYEFYIMYNPSSLTSSPSTTVTFTAVTGSTAQLALTGTKQMIANDGAYEGFEGDVFPPVGWTTTDGMYGGWSAYGYGGNSGSKCAVVSFSDMAILTTPRLDLTDSENFFEFYFADVFDDTEDDGSVPYSQFVVELSKDGGKTWTESLFELTYYNNAFEQVSMTLGAYGDNCYIRFTYYIEGLESVTSYDDMPTYSVTYLDDVVLPKLYGADGAPGAATVLTPANGAKDVYNKMLALSWGKALFATDYKLYVGTSATSFDLVNGLAVGDVASYTIETVLPYETTYYWKVVPTNSVGDATDVPVWSFTTVSDNSVKVLPHFEGFEGGTIPLGWNSTKDVYTEWDIANWGAFDGSCSAMASGSTVGSSTILTTTEVTLPDSAQISFYWGNSAPISLTVDNTGTAKNPTTEPNEYDCTYFEIEVDGVWKTLAMLSNNDEDYEYWFRERHSLTEYAGKVVTFRWRYEVYNYMSNYASLDNILIETTAGNCLAFFNTTEWAAGEVNYNKSVTSKDNKLMITNGGGEDLTISSVSFTSDNFTSTLTAGTVIASDGVAHFNNTFNAGSLESTVDAEMVVMFTNGQSLTLSVSGTGLASDVVFYDFESDEHGTTSPQGFTMIDADAVATISPVLIYYPNRGTAFAYIVLNCEADYADWRNVYPRSGDQVLVAIGDQSETYTTNDWIVSPKMIANSNSNFRFYAKSYGNPEDWDLHDAKVMVSTTSATDMSTFELVKSMELPYDANGAFTEFNVDLSAYAGKSIYIALVHEATVLAFVAFFDDFYYEHLEIDPTGTKQISTMNVAVSPNPTSDMVYVSGVESATITVYATTGTVMDVVTGTSVDMSSYATGVYMVQIVSEEGVETVRVIKK